MNQLDEYIISAIEYHLDSYGIIFEEKDISDMVKATLNDGVTVFQIIYNLRNELESWSPIDSKLVVFREEMYSYDSGKRFQWFPKETIQLDVSIIRQMKLNDIDI
jgi:hypothetical protein